MLLGTPPEQIRCVAWHGGRETPIPFQIDERKEVWSKSGKISLDYVFPYGPFADRTDDQTFDGNDLLVLLAKDLGDQESENATMSAAQAVAEVEVSDPRNGARGFGSMFLEVRMEFLYPRRTTYATRTLNDPSVQNIMVLPFLALTPYYLMVSSSRQVVIEEA